MLVITVDVCIRTCVFIVSAKNSLCDFQLKMSHVVRIVKHIFFKKMHWMEKLVNGRYAIGNQPGTYLEKKA